MSKKPSIKKELVPVLFLTIVVCIAVIALTLTNDATHEPIEDGKASATVALLSELFPEMTDFTLDDATSIYIIKQDSDVIGYSYSTSGNGYGGAIDILVGFTKTDFTEGNIILQGISIIKQAETPGLGTKILEDPFLTQFQGLNTDDIALSQNGGQIDAITGATISSSAVTDAVSQSIAEKIDDLRQLNSEVS